MRLNNSNGRHRYVLAVDGYDALKVIRSLRRKERKNTVRILKVIVIIETDHHNRVRTLVSQYRTNTVIILNNNR